MNPLNEHQVVSFEVAITGLDDVTVRSEELMVSVAAAIAAQFELCRPRQDTIVVELVENDELGRLAALALCVWAVSAPGGRVIAVNDYARSWFAAALVGVDEIVTTIDAVAVGLHPIAIPPVPPEASLTGQLGAVHRVARLAADVVATGHHALTPRPRSKMD